MRNLRPKITRPRVILALALVLAFGGLGIYLLRPSKAAEVTAQPALLSLAPATHELVKGEVVNLAVNVAADSNQRAGEVDVHLIYPTSLDLQAVRDACPGPAFAQPQVDTSSAGKVAIHCKSAAGASSRATIAMLVFGAKEASGTASVAIDTSSSVLSANNSGQLAGTFQGSNLSFKATTSDLTALKRSSTLQPQARLVTPQCPKNAASPASCEGAPYLEPVGGVGTRDFLTSDFDPSLLHIAYQMPCASGSSTVQRVCPQPSSYGSATIDLVTLGGYSTGIAGIESDLAAFDQKFGFPSCTASNGCLSMVDDSGGGNLPGGYSSGWDGDKAVRIMVTAAHSMCQTCKIKLVATDPVNFIDSRNKAASYASQSGAAAVAFYLMTNTDIPKRDNGSFSHNKGVALIIASSDTATYGDPNTAGPYTDEDGWPGSLPGNIFVASSNLTLTADGHRATEVVYAGSSGGCSTAAAAPSWQTSLPNWTTDGCGTERAVGDLSLHSSLFGDDAFPVYDKTQGAWVKTGGGYVTGPLVAAMFGLAGSIPANQTGAEVLYKNATADTVYDITTGNDCNGTATNTHCTAHAGFDEPSGLGAPKGIGLFGGKQTTTNIGDLNGDSKVNIQDLALLLINFGKTGDASKGDLNGDSKINVQDLALLLIHFGK